MGFIPDDTPADTRATSLPDNAQDKLHATQLANALRSQRKLTGQPNIPTWATAIRKLRAQGHSHKDIARAVQWIASNPNHPRAPLIFSAITFRSKFPALLAAIEIAEVHGPATVDISPLAAALHKTLGLLWPANTDKADALPTIELSIQAHAALRAKWLAKRDAATDQAVRLLWEHMLAKLGTAPTLVAWWMHWVHQTAHRWDAWQGNLRRWRFRPNHKKFIAEVIRWVREFSARPAAITEVLETLK